MLKVSDIVVSRKIKAIVIEEVRHTCNLIQHTYNLIQHTCVYALGFALALAAVAQTGNAYKVG